MTRKQFLILSLLCVGLAMVNAASAPFPFDSCKTYVAGQFNATVLFCSGPNSIPHRYIVKFHDTASDSQINDHLRMVNGTLPAGDCSLGNTTLSSICGNCTDSILGPPSDVAEDIVICARCGSERSMNLYASNRSKPSQCGFHYVYNTTFNSTFRGYAAALHSSALQLVLNDPIVIP